MAHYRDISTQQATMMEVKSNSFCASGMHLPNGSFANFGGNDAVGRAGLVTTTTQKNPDGTGAWDSEYDDFDGRLAIRIVNPCTSTDNLSPDTQCGWYDEPTVLAMKKRRWYSAAEPTGDGTIVILGGFVTGGFINRWVPNTDPTTERGSAENTYEFFPPRDVDPPIVNFLVNTSGLNAYAHTYMMPSGKMLVQANLSTSKLMVVPLPMSSRADGDIVLWDYNENQEFPLPDMPNGVARVYPASGAVAMLPLTPGNNYEPTLIFCGGSDMPEAYYGDYAGPAFDTWTYPASNDCQRLTPEPQDGSVPAYEQDDDMLEGRTMGQFILLPDGTALVINGGLNGTAGYSLGTKNTPLAQMPFGVSLASGPVGTPAIYNPNAPKGKRWSNAGLGTSNIARLYHSTAILLPDASVLIAGSNPNPDVDLNTFFKTEYRAEFFYPQYFSATVRPAPQGRPNTLTYGGNPFDITIPSSSYTGNANDAAGNTTVVLARGGFTTHAMNMGQRHLQLNNTYTVNKDGSIILHVSQMPPNANIFQPGPALMFVNIHGIPSNGTYVIVGSGRVETQQLLPVGALPASVRLDLSATGTGSTNGSGTTAGDSNSTSSKLGTGALVGIIAGGAAALAIVAALLGLCFARRRREVRKASTFGSSYVAGQLPMAMAEPRQPYNALHNDSSVFAPVKADRYDDAWDPSTASLNAPYKDDIRASSSRSFDTEYDPYSHPGYPTASHAVPNPGNSPLSSPYR